MILIFAMYLISASTFLLTKELLLHCSPLFLVGVRTCIAGLFFLLAALLTTKQIINSIRKFLLPCIFIGFYSFLVSNTLKFWALNSLSATHAAIISITEPLFAMIIAYCMFHEKMSFKKCVGLMCCMSSGFIVVNEGSLVVRTPIFDFLTMPGLMMCGAIAASAYGALLMRKIIRYENASPLLVNGMSMTLAGAVALLGTCAEMWSCTVTEVTVMPFAMNLMFLILLSNIIAYSIYSYLLKWYSVVLISCGSFIKPLAVICYKSIFLHESVPWYVGHSALVLFFGLAIMYSDEFVSQETTELVV